MVEPVVEPMVELVETDPVVTATGVSTSSTTASAAFGAFKNQ